VNPRWQAATVVTQVFVIEKKKGIMKLTDFGSRSRANNPGGGHPKTEDSGRKNNQNRRPNKILKRLCQKRYTDKNDILKEGKNKREKDGKYG
jgi:hypothetical protein